MPTVVSEFSTLSSDNNAANKTDLELNTTAVPVHTTLASAHVNGAGWKRKWTIPRKCDCLFKKTCIVYTLILAAIWILYTIPIIVFYATSATVTNATGYEANATGNNTDYNTSLGVSADVDRDCSDDFYLDNSSGLCRPECGEWDQYSPSTHDSVVGINVTFALLTILICVATFVWSIVRHNIMFRFPNIMLVYITITHAMFATFHLVGYTDEKALFCTSRDREISFERGTPYCSITGAAVTFIPTFDLIVLCFQLGTVLFTAYFPFRAREFESKGRYKYIHLTAIITAVTFPTLLVAVQFGLGGYSRTVVPIFCLADIGSSFVFAIIPSFLTSATFLSLVMLLLIKILDIAGWKLKPKPMTNGNEESNSPTHRYTSAQVKLILTFCAYGVANVILYSAYSVVLKREDAYSQALEQYFDCESTGVMVGKSCDRSTFEALDATPITFPLTTVAYMLLPLATLIYVVDIEQCRKAKLKLSEQF
jgi:hypothetical protein